MATVSLFAQRIPAELARKLERTEALAREALIDVHANLALDLVGVLAPRMPFDEAIERYIESMDLQGEDAEAVGTRAVALLSEREVADDLQREGHRGWGWDWRYATPMGAMRYIQRQKQRSDEEQLWLELAAARAEEALVNAHMEYATQFIGLMDEHEYADPSRAVQHYVETLGLPELRARMVYQRTMARCAATLLPRLPAD
ncbi:MAG TPA: hypothetical protein VF665_14625 [Longimicrobium sp.]|jgi:hypothetical protein|uniref:hypothetical protein n=1 Tax=Longimicrobium sp. TaxID=2029185 RepID=UPI002ED82AF4